MGLFSKMAKSAVVLAAFAVVNSAAVKVNNPIMYVDSPDPSIVRVDDAYYMPGVPVFKSTDLAQWRTVGYAYQTLANNDQQNLNGGRDAYGKGSWASSIRYHKGFFYVLTPSYTTGKTHLYKTADVESGQWSEVQLPFYHDPSLFFDDDGTVFGGLEGGVVEEFLQDPNACICIGELFGIHVARAHHFCTIGVVAVDVGTVFVALLLSRLHFLLGGGSQLLLLFKAGSDDLYAPLLPGHVSRFFILEVINTKK